MLPCPLIHFEWTIEALVGFHLMEPFLGIMLDLHPRPTHSQLRIIFQNLYEQMMNPIEGLKFSSIDQHALPALSDGFFRTYKKSWMNSFRQHLAQYDLERVESAVRTVMKTLAATLSRQRGIQYEFGPEYAEYSAKKATGEQGQSHLRPLSEIFSLEQLDEIPVDNKVGENYFGEMTVQLRAKGGSSFKAIGERLVLSSNSDLAFSEGAEKMLANKELKAKKKEIEKIEAEWSKAQKDITKAKVSTTDELADTLAREQSKNKLLAQCIENGRKFKYNAPVTSQDDVKLMFAKIQKLKEEDKLVLMRKEIKFKKMVFSELPTDFVMFKQYNITASKMFQNLMALHAVDPANQESISVEDIYEVTDALASLPSLHRPKASRKKQSSAQVGQESLADLEWPPQEEEFVVALEADGWRICCVISYDEAHKTITAHQLEPIKTRAKDDYGKTYWIYSAEEKEEVYEKKNILSVRPSVVLAKNIKQKDPVFALINRELIEGVSASLFA